MKFYLAPMEGVTGYIYRKTYHTYYNHIDKFFSPFIAANNQSMKTREIKDVLPEHNQGMNLIPQILTNKAEDFIFMSKMIKDLGYDEVNLNLGCPSGTVVAKGRGSGFLAKPDELEVFLDKIFNADITKISIKTRIGKNSPDEFYHLLQMYNKFPMTELIIHPRTQQDYYKNKPNLEMFRHSLEESKHSICYNGDIFTPQDYQAFREAFPTVDTIMVGRGLIANPGLVGEIYGACKRDLDRLKQFHDTLYDEYRRVLYGDVPVLHKMKELWLYLHHLFTENEKYYKKIKKSHRLDDYEAAIHNLFSEQTLVEHQEFPW